jgi:hypothetical protein
VPEGLEGRPRKGGRETKGPTTQLSPFNSILLAAGGVAGRPACSEDRRGGRVKEGGRGRGRGEGRATCRWRGTTGEASLLGQSAIDDLILKLMAQ